MSFIPTANTARVSIEGTYVAAPIVNTLWFAKSSPFSGGDLDTLLSTLDGLWASQMLPHLSPDYEAEIFRAWAQDSDTAPTTAFVPGTPRLGTDAGGGNLPAQAALCFTHHTADRGRSARGRTYMGGIAGANQADVQHLEGTFVSNWVLDWIDLRTGMAAAGYTFVVVSHRHNKVDLTAGIARPVVSTSANTRIDTIRNRLGN